MKNLLSYCKANTALGWALGLEVINSVVSLTLTLVLGNPVPPRHTQVGLRCQSSVQLHRESGSLHLFLQLRLRSKIQVVKEEQVSAEYRGLRAIQAGAKLDSCVRILTLPLTSCVSWKSSSPCFHFLSANGVKVAPYSEGCYKNLITIDSLYPQVVHPWIQPTMDK